MTLNSDPLTFWSLSKVGTVEARQETPKKSSNFAKFLSCDDKPSLLPNKIASSLNVEIGGKAEIYGRIGLVLRRLTRHNQSTHRARPCHDVQNRRHQPGNTAKKFSGGMGHPAKMFFSLDREASLDKRFSIFLQRCNVAFFFLYPTKPVL